MANYSPYSYYCFIAGNGHRVISDSVVREVSCKCNYLQRVQQTTGRRGVERIVLRGQDRTDMSASLPVCIWLGNRWSLHTTHRETERNRQIQEETETTDHLNVTRPIFNAIFSLLPIVLFDCQLPFMQTDFVITVIVVIQETDRQNFEN